MATVNPGDKVVVIPRAVYHAEHLAELIAAGPVVTIVRQVSTAAAPGAVNAFTYGLVSPIGEPEYEVSSGVLVAGNNLVLVERAPAAAAESAVE